MDASALVNRCATQLREAFAPLIPRGQPVALVDFPDSPNCGDHAVWLGEQALLSELGAPAAYACSAQTYNRDEMAAKLGFKQAIVPKANLPKQKIEGLEIIGVERVREAIARFREG